MTRSPSFKPPPVTSVFVPSLSPVVMTWFLAKGTGAALLEKDIGDRRPDYVDYVRRTSGFVPLPPRKS